MSDDTRALELALCARCANGDVAAIAELEARYFGEIDRAIAGLDREGDLVAEIRQRVRTRLFVGAERKADANAEGAPAITKLAAGAPGITKFAGAGPLGRWLVVVATREALMYLRTARRERARAHAASELAARDYELHVLRREYRPAFEQAFADALAELSSKDRNLLYYHLVGGLGIDRIGALYRVHRVTAFRWLRDARAALVARTRELLAERMQLATDELESLLRLVQSRASVSVERLLRQARTDSIPA
jgi:RNA polymerase sigma-70 factor (ECF subfamily)